MPKLITVTTAHAEDDVEISITNFVVSDDTSVNAKLIECMEHLHDLYCQSDEDGYYRSEEGVSEYASQYSSWRDDEFLVKLYTTGADCYSISEANTLIAQQSIKDMIFVSIKETNLNSLFNQPKVYLPDHVG